MQLCMYIDDVLIESIPINLKALKTAAERERHVQQIVQTLNEKHLEKIIHTRFFPEYYIEGVQSKLNFEEK
ncbi:MAG TPA: hypothetical protein VEZ55_09775 [Chitinophagaceae bacterium]|nr:hypothetical protein [Chitinophagaceae bacterium]